MKQLTLAGNLTIAILISLMAIAAFILLQMLFNNDIALKINWVLITLFYLGYLLYVSPTRPGKVTLTLTSVILSGTLLLINPTFDIFLMSLISMVWISRSLLFYHSIISSLLDLGLCVIGACLAIAAFLTSGNVYAGIWCFLLIQALFVFIPQLPSRSKRTEANLNTDPFNQAYQNAESAIRELANKS